VNPCGRIVDFSRVCYHFRTRDIQNGPLKTAVYYFVPRDRPVIPFATVFGIRNWEQQEIPAGIGEEPGRGPYYRGTDTLGLTGDHFCGTEQQWLRGASPLDPLPDINPATGQPVCCGPGPLAAAGGAAAGGNSQTNGTFTFFGGAAAGGNSKTFLRLTSTGGEADGGNSATAAMITSTGGEADGGNSSTAAMITSTGGEADGGNSSTAAMITSTGGEADGGTSTGLAGLFSSGGSSAGGNSVAQGGKVSTGGSAAGGAYVGAHCNCFTGTNGRAEYTFTTAGYTDDNCVNCNRLAGTFTVHVLPSENCTWVSDTFLGPDDVEMNWVLIAVECDHWQLFTTPASIHGEGAFFEVFTTWDGESSLTLAATMFPLCCFTPSTITVFPV
jgi:hypothetical protein